MIHAALLAAGEQPASDLEIWLRFFGIVVSIFGSVTVAVLTLLMAQRKLGEKVDIASVKADTAANKAEEAAKWAKPTGNGFAAEVLTQLADIQKQSSANAAALTQLNTRTDKIAEFVTDHIRDHVRSGLDKKNV